MKKCRNCDKSTTCGKDLYIELYEDIKNDNVKIDWSHEAFKELARQGKVGE